MRDKGTKWVQRQAMVDGSGDEVPRSCSSFIERQHLMQTYTPLNALSKRTVYTLYTLKTNCIRSVATSSSSSSSSHGILFLSVAVSTTSPGLPTGGLLPCSRKANIHWPQIRLNCTYTQKTKGAI